MILRAEAPAKGESSFIPLLLLSIDLHDQIAASNFCNYSDRKGCEKIFKTMPKCHQCLMGIEFTDSQLELNPVLTLGSAEQEEINRMLNLKLPMMGNLLQPLASCSKALLLHTRDGTRKCQTWQACLYTKVMCPGPDVAEEMNSPLGSPPDLWDN
ncbi:hypothetical protein TURU_133457 [Turdus rufiventris]|nr:hypothetical protein TURU_133457 [Turdus rufiventris]